MDRLRSQPQELTKAAARERWSTRRWGDLSLWSVTVVGFLFLYVPILILILFSFNDSRLGGRWEGWTLEWYRALLRNQDLFQALLNSLEVATVATTVATVIGTMTALAMERYRFRGQTFFDGVLYMPIAIPDIVMAVSLLAFFSLILGAINDLFGWQLRMGLPTVMISHIAFNISFATVTVRA
ncbi:MAG: ABC transporter permease, partial [Ardenticatenaceae bacterium]